MKENVIFRIDKVHLTVFAMFPEIPGDPTGATCKALCLEGVEFAACTPKCMKDSLPAAYPVYGLLADWLTAKGYDLVVVKRETKAMREVRRASAHMDQLND